MSADSRQGVRLGQPNEDMRWGCAALVEQVAAAGQSAARQLGGDQVRKVVGGQGEAQLVVGGNQRGGRKISTS
jgi:hypothetical protein